MLLAACGGMIAVVAAADGGMIVVVAC